MDYAGIHWRNRRPDWRSVVVLVVTVVLTATSVAAVGQTPPRDRPALENTCYLVPGSGFPDLGSGQLAFTHGTAIDCMLAYGLTQGTAAGTYEPARDVRRWQMALFLTRLAELAADQLDELVLPADPQADFTDIGGLSQEAQDAIALLAELGITQGVTNDLFAPFDPVTRGQMASFINRLQGAIQAALGDDARGFVTEQDFFTDDDGSVHEDNINGIASVGITKGSLASRRFLPGVPVTRAQMASFLIRHLGVNVDAGVLTSLFSLPDDPVDPERISRDFVDLVAVGDLGLAGEISTPRALAEVSAVDDITGVVSFFFTPASQIPTVLFEYGGGEFLVAFDIPGTADALFVCRTEAGLVRSCFRTGVS